MCSFWIATVVLSDDSTTLQKYNFLGILVFGCSDAVFSVLALDRLTFRQLRVKKVYLCLWVNIRDLLIPSIQLGQLELCDSIFM